MARAASDRASASATARPRGRRGSGLGALANVGTRVALLAAAVATVAFMVAAERADRPCRAAGQEVFAASGGFFPLSRLDPAIDRLRDSCRDPAALLASANALRAARFPGRAAALARAVTRSEPENYGAWVELALSAARSDPAEARAARRRARELNPLLGRRRPGAPG